MWGGSIFVERSVQRYRPELSPGDGLVTGREPVVAVDPVPAQALRG
ncbi:MAG: hypothetical protein V5A28_13690 [Haloarculaceae archaeon]